MLKPTLPDPPASWTVASIGSSRAVCAPALALKQWRPWLECLPALLDSEVAREIRHSSLLSTGRRTVLVRGPDTRPLIVKCYPGAPPGAPACPDPARAHDSACTAFHRQADLWRRGLPVPEPLIFLETIRPGSRPTGYGISRALEGCQPLFDFAFEHLCRRPVSPARLAEWRRAVVGTIVGLHQSGYSHGDLHNRNLLIQPQRSRGDIKAFFIDFDACRLGQGPIPRLDQLRDLASLAASLYQLAPGFLLGKALLDYFRAFPGSGNRCRQSLPVLRQEYRKYLRSYLSIYERVQEYHFAQAAQSLLAMEERP